MKTRTWIGTLAAAVAIGAVLVSGTATLAAGGTQVARTARVDAALAPAACNPGTRACPRRIVFARGAYSGQAGATLTGMGSERWFSVRARAGQTLVVIVKGEGPTRGSVFFPNGGSSGQPGGRVFDGVLPASGDYRIRVTESSMGEAWSGHVDVVALIY